MLTTQWLFTVHIHSSNDTCDIASRNLTSRIHIMRSILSILNDLPIVFGQMLELIFFKRSLFVVVVVVAVIHSLPFCFFISIQLFICLLPHILCAHSIRCSFGLFSHPELAVRQMIPSMFYDQRKCRVEILIIIVVRNWLSYKQ